MMDPTTSLHAIVYVSTATRLLSDAELETLMQGARQRNQDAGITGVLLYNEGNFMQYFEGSVAALDTTFARIKSSRQHKDIIELLHEPIAERMFPSWHMGLTHPSKSAMLTLSTAQWPLTTGTPDAASAATLGLKLLKSFWDNGQR
jgi:hypothetical protein